jgi:hypothetical protein
MMDYAALLSELQQSSLIRRLTVAQQQQMSQLL